MAPRRYFQIQAQVKVWVHDIVNVDVKITVHMINKKRIGTYQEYQ